jgi:hypothetical protein
MCLKSFFVLKIERKIELPRLSSSLRFLQADEDEAEEVEAAGGHPGPLSSC